MLDKIISYSFYTLFFLTPLFWTSLNYELFEYNKMILTYGLTVVIVGSWLLKIINHKSLILNRTPLDIPLLLFLGANILSTIFSIDLHTSIWGYYSRSNGGLLSIICYLLLYWAFVSNVTADKIKPLLKIGLASGLIIAVWGILEHFQVSPSCVILRGEFNADCWVQKVYERVFATLGQPNWMAAYLAMLIFPALYFFLSAPSPLLLTTYYLLLVIYYLAFTFTYSRGPTLGLIVGFITLIGLYILRLHPKGGIVNIVKLKSLLIVILSFLVINVLFGSALTSFRLVSKFAAPARPTISLPSNPSVGTQLENGGTESGQIRFIVWHGALDIFKHYPLFGSGVETFAYSYYQFRPKEHNLTSEWDFLYNKAHNEYLNYLATTGIVGFGTYLIIIIIFIKFIIVNTKYQASLILKRKGTKNLLLYSILASYISYLIYNFFLFSVVIIAVFFYLFPALVFVATDSISTFHLPASKFHHLFSIIYRRKIYTNIAKGIVIFSTLYLLYSIFQLWYADTLFNQGQKASDLGNPGKAYNLLSMASDLNKGEPFYRSELSYSAAAAAAALKETDASLSAALEDEALNQLKISLTISPKNVSFWRTAIRTYYELASLDKKYVNKTLEALDMAIKLAPTDPKLYYNKALILESIGKKDEEIENLKTTLNLKPDYLEALEQLKEATKSGSP
ncbi:O-antigen ligase family protein [Candidatus Daviesbacteria bacterium]|nr:O-antigen ligase family protein [Candidatus Daviesbacteria bacterium]